MIKCWLNSNPCHSYQKQIAMKTVPWYAWQPIFLFELIKENFKFWRLASFCLTFWSFALTSSDAKIASFKLKICATPTSPSTTTATTAPLSHLTMTQQRQQRSMMNQQKKIWKNLRTDKIEIFFISIEKPTYTNYQKKAIDILLKLNLFLFNLLLLDTL